MLKRQNAIGLLELMLSIVVITAIILGATKYYLVAKEEMRIVQAQEIIDNVAKAAYTWVGGQPNFVELTGIDVLTNAGLLPLKYKNDNANPWGGNIKIQPAADGSMIHITFGGLEKGSKACKILDAKYGMDDCDFRFMSP